MTAGYDLVLEANGVVRHVQLKSSFDTATTRAVNASMKLMQEPSACVVWIRFDPATLDLGPFFWFGGAPNLPVPNLREFPVAKHAKANSQGIKLERPNQRRIPRSHFERIEAFDELVSRLFGEFNMETPGM